MRFRLTRIGIFDLIQSILTPILHQVCNDMKFVHIQHKNKDREKISFLKNLRELITMTIKA